MKHKTTMSFLKFNNITIRVLSIIGFLMFSQSCESEAEDVRSKQNETDDKDELYHYEALSLNPFGISAFIYLPDETANIGVTEPAVSHEMDSFKWLIKLSKDFVLRIDDWGQDDGIIIQKRIMEDNMNIFDIEVIESTDNTLAYKQMVRTYNDEQKEEKALYFYFHQHTIDGINYVFGTLPTGAPESTYTYIQTSASNVEEILIDK